MVHELEILSVMTVNAFEMYISTQARLHICSSNFHGKIKTFLFFCGKREAEVLIPTHLRAYILSPQQIFFSTLDYHPPQGAKEEGETGLFRTDQVLLILVRFMCMGYLPLGKKNPPP